MRHYLRAMAASPELAPDDQNHLLDTSSTIQAIQYTPERITYTKFDAVSIDHLKLGAWTPGLVTGGLLRWDGSARVAEIAAGATSVTIERADSRCRAGAEAAQGAHHASMRHGFAKLITLRLGAGFQIAADLVRTCRVSKSPQPAGAATQKTHGRGADGDRIAFA